MSHRLAARAAATFLLVAAGPVAASCGSAFCMVNTNWGVQGVWNEPGLRADLRLEYIDQDQPRTGTRDVAVGEIPQHHDEVRTINRNAFLTLDYGISEAWGVSAVLPWIDRDHEHIHNHHGEQLRETWSFADFGDARVVARYQFATAPAQAQADRLGFVGFTGGLKLPTGKTDVVNGEGEPAERSLQPGTGTTDALLGAYYREAIGHLNASWFVQATGAQAEPDDSGSRTLSIAPGFTFAFTPAVQMYAFVQFPLYQYVNGVQLVADRSYAAGISAQF